MLKSSSMLRSVYSHIKEPLRKTLSKYRLINKRKSGIREHRHRGRERGKHRGKCTKENSKTLGWRVLRGKGEIIYEKHTVHRPCLVSNKGQTWKPTKVVIG
jgi:hypothetical protein